MAEPLFDSLQRLREGFSGHPPVEQWHPDLCGDMDLQICADGRWVHEGAEIQREALVRLFASVLKREGDDYFLVTPVEKWRVQVDDAPFLITQVARGEGGAGPEILLTTNTGDVLTLGPDSQWSLRPFGTPPQPVPYVVVRANLEARVSREAYYSLVEWGEERPAAGGCRELVLRSCGTEFLLGSYEPA